MGRGKRSEFNLIYVHEYTFILIRDARLLCVVSGILFDLSGDLGRGLCRWDLRRNIKRNRGLQYYFNVDNKG